MVDSPQIFAAKHAIAKLDLGMYNKRTDRFDLSYTKAYKWWQHSSPPPVDLEGFASILMDNGVIVYEVRPRVLECEFKPGRIWEILSGLPSDPQIERNYELARRTHLARRARRRL